MTTAEDEYDRAARAVRLEKAAPDLLAALEAVLAAWLRDAGECDGIREEDAPVLLAARLAIAKAKGGRAT